MNYLRLVQLTILLNLVIACQPASRSYIWDIPPGFPEPQVPIDNPMTMEKIALGKALFNDRRLSINQQQACASCHIESLAFSDPRPKSVGTTGETLKRNSMALVNIAYNSDFTWAHNGFDHLEQQILIPLFAESPVEMGAGQDQALVLSRLSDYQAQFQQVFGTGVSFDGVVKALAAFVRSLTYFDSDFDRYAYYQDDSALGDAEIRGMDLFFSEKLECFHCHGGFNFSQANKHQSQSLDLQPFHNTGLFDGSDQGLAEFTLNERDIGKFRAPSLRNIVLTAPYMHDGSIATLAEVIDVYAAGGRGEGIDHPNKSIFIKGFDITEQEKNDLLLFLNSLTDNRLK